MRRLLILAAMAACATTAHAADMPEFPLRGSFPAGISSTRAIWEGFYIGGQAGQTWMDSKPASNYNNDITAAYLTRTGLNYAFPAIAGANGSGSGYGGFIGYNSQWEDVVVGVEGSYLHGNVRAASNNILNGYVNGVLDSTTQSNLAMTVKDFATLRLRGGYMIGNLLPYAFVGAGIGRADFVRSAGASLATNVPLPLPAFETATLNDRVVYGYSAGVGIDINIIGGLFARAEYEYMRLTSRIDTSVNSARVGLGYKF